jgi:hypothetical protein
MSIIVSLWPSYTLQCQNVPPLAARHHIYIQSMCEAINFTAICEPIV